MIQSMTGYGKTVVAYKGKKINVEIKSLNSKQLDLTTRIAPLYREKEMEIRQMIAEQLQRGKVEFAIWIEKDAATEGAVVNTTLMDSYYRQLEDFAQEHHLSGVDWMQTLIRMPDVLTKTEVEVLDDEEWQVARQGVCEAVQHLVDFRTQEGAALEKKFAEKIDNIERLMLSIEPYEKSRVEKIRSRIVEGLKQIPEAEYDKNRLEQELAEIEPWEKGRVEKIRQRITDGLLQIPGVDYDKNRLEQELIYYIEKLDISEEKQRLANHLKYFRETMADAPGQGKKLGFIAQEMGREINTTGSKSNQAEMQNIVVMMKDELEQIKEQVLNAL